MNVQTFYTKHKRPIVWIAIILGLALVFWFVFREVNIGKDHSAEIKKLDERNKYLESENYKDSLYRLDEAKRVDTFNNVITLTNERIIYNTKIYEKIIHLYDTASANEHERYYRTRYGSDTASNQR